jgi:predicted permease
MNILNIVYYTFLTVLQIYILICIGVLASIKKVHKKMVSEVIFNFLLPIYAIFYLASTTTWKNIEIMWILVLTVFFAMSFAFLLAKIIYKLFKLDCRIQNSFPYLISLPSIGSLPLVLARSFCYPDGMLEGDPNCKDIQGFMVMNCLIYFVIVFVLGFSLLPKDANLSNSLSDKMRYLWHLLIPKLFDKDYTIKSLFEIYMKDKKTAKHMFSVFDKKYKLKVEDGEIPKYKLINDHSVKLEFNLEHHYANFIARNPAYERCSSGMDDEMVELDEKNKDIANFYYSNHYFENYGDKSNTEEKGVNHEINISVKEDREDSKRQEIPKDILVEKSGNPQILVLHSDDHNKQLSVNHLDENKEIEEIKEKQRKLSHRDIEELKIDNLRRLATLGINSNDLTRYYILAFVFIEININKDKVLLFEEEQKKIFEHTSESPPKFPIVKNIELNSEKIKLIDDEWDRFEKKIKQSKKDFIFEPKQTSIDINYIIVKVLSPPIVCSFLGMLIGLSGMRDILFSSNHYISNVESGLYVVVKATVPFLYIALGMSISDIKNINFHNTPISTKYVVISFVLRFVIIPCIGLLWVYLWTTYFGGIVAESKVFRISMFIPFCLPCASTATVVVAILGILKDETSLLLCLQNLTMVITLTIWYVIYFVTVGS